MTLQNRALSSLGVVCTASSYAATRPPWHAADANDTTYWRAAQTPTTGAWWQVDLLASYYVRRVRILNYGSLPYHATAIDVYAGDDPAALVLVATVDTTPYETVVDIPEVQARYVKFLATAGGASEWRVLTFEVWGDDQAAPPGPNCNSTTAYLIQYVWDHYYQDAFTAIQTLFPLWNFEEMDAWHIAFHVAVWKQVLCACAQQQGGTECLFDPTAILAAISNLDGDVQSGITALATNENANRDVITGLIGTPAVSLAVDALQQTADINAHTTAERVVINASTEQARLSIEANDNGNTSGLVGTINAARDSLLADAATKHSAITTTVVSGLSQQTTDLAGALGTTHDGILAAVQAIPDPSPTLEAILEALGQEAGGGNQWPGLDGVTLLPAVQVYAPVVLDGPMDGVLIDVVAYPAGQSRQPCGTTTRYKGLAWVAFIAETGDAEALQQVQFTHSIAVPRDMLTAEQVAVYCKPGSHLTVTPYTVNPA